MDRIEQLCAERGMRMTEQRRVIARVLSNAEDHPDVEELYRRASIIDPHISIATVYRTVRLFEEAGVVEKHDFGDGRSRYEEAGDDHHDHLIDTRTGEVIEFFDAEIERGRELQAGIRAAEDIQLPERDTRQIEKQDEKRAQDVLEGIRIRQGVDND